jgi:hypothetical protein
MTYAIVKHILNCSYILMIAQYLGEHVLLRNILLNDARFQSGTAEPKVSLSCSQQLSTDPYPEPEKSSP